MEVLKTKTNKFFKNNNLSNIQGIISIVLGIILAMFVVSWFFDTMNLNVQNCDNLNDVYSSKDNFISSIQINNSHNQSDLRNYYIKTAYNCCSSGNFKNDYVNLCALKKCIQQGVRCLDFEIYSLKNEPVIAASFMNDFTEKGTFNSIPFESALSVIEQCAFNAGGECKCPNSDDPLILHFRIMSKNKEIYDKMAKSISNVLKYKILGEEYSYENYKNHVGSSYFIGAEPLISFMNKIIIAVEYNSFLKETKLHEFVNICSNSPFMKIVRSGDLKTVASMDDMMDSCRQFFCICLPNISSKSDNYSPSLAVKYGCQMIGMSFQNFDANLEFYSKLFDDAGTAFILKPESLQYKRIELPEPPKQNCKKFGYAPKEKDSHAISTLTGGSLTI